MAPCIMVKSLRLAAVFAASLTCAVNVCTARAQGVGSVSTTQNDRKSPAPSAVLPIKPDSTRWRFASHGKYLLVTDPRGLMQVYHPWEVAETGDYGALTTTVTVPRAWKGPITLNVYANDTYVNDGWDKVKPGWTHTYAAWHNFVGHRFKQVLIDEKVIWEQDIGDAEAFGYFSLDITSHVRPGKSFTLTLRVFDRVGSATVLPGDDFHLGVWSWQGQGDPKARQKFYTRVFWGDVALSQGGPVPAESDPARQGVSLKPIRTAAAEPVRRADGRLVLSCPNGLPGEGYPVTWGVPFAQGALRDPKRVRIADPDGVSLPLQTEVKQKWPDGSIRWLLLDFMATGASANRAYQVTYGAEVAAVEAGAALAVSRKQNVVTVDTGALRFTVGGPGSGHLIEGITLAGEAKPIGDSLDGEVVTRDGWISSRCVPKIEEVKAEASGPLRATILVTGRMMEAKRSLGRFTFRVHAYRGKPYVRVFFRIFNDTDAPAQLVEEYFLRLQTALRNGEAVLGDQRRVTDDSETGRLLVRQHKFDAYEVFEGSDARRATGAHWERPVLLRTADQCVSGQVRNFAQQYPNRMWAGMGGQLVFDLFTRTVDAEQYVMTRGEAKRHELLLDFRKGPVDERAVEALFRTFAAPPVLMSAEWYADQQAFGRGAPLTKERFPELSRWMLESQPSLACNVPLGIRNWPDTYSDSIYNAYRGTWGNMYQEVDYGALVLALLGGRRDWFDYAEAYQGHFMDIDICHHSTDPAFIGASYGISPYHTGHQPYPLNAPLSGLFLLYYLTGDPDAQAAAVGIANWLQATNLGIGEGSGRAVGWPLRSLAIAYENTSDPRYLESCKRLAAYAVKSLEPRRGFFSETPATWNYRGGVSVMNGILAAGLMHYWRVAGDAAAGQACANVAYNMAYSWMSPTEPGLILGADPLQALYLTGYAMQDIVPIFWGYELTGDKRFLEFGAQVMQASILDEKFKGSAFGLSRYWEMQDILYYYGMAKKAAKPAAGAARSVRQ
jgi:hypothetical protein